MTNDLLKMSKQGIRFDSNNNRSLSVDNHLFSMGIVQESECKGCSEEEESPIHILYHYEAYANSKHIVLGLGILY